MFQIQKCQFGFSFLLQVVKSRVCFVLFSSIFLSFSVEALSLATVRNPRTFFLNYSSVSIKALAFSCLALTEIPDDIPCQPAMIRLEKKPRFAANASISNGYGALAKARRILSNDLDADLINGLFAEDQIIEVEMNPSLYFTSQYISGKYLPYGLQFYSTQRNQANPELEVFASESKQFVFQTAYSLQNWLLVGLQARSQQDKVVDKSFRLVDLGTDHGKDLLKPQEFSRLFVEPGLALIGESWKFSVLGSGIAVAGEDSESKSLPGRPEAQFGVSYQAPLSYSILDVSVDYKSLSYLEESPDQKIHAGARLRYGALSLLAGVDTFGVSGGMLFSIEKIYSGILYSTSQVPWRDSEEFAQTVYIELGWQL